METWYLIIILLGGGKAVEHIPFADQASCVYTRNIIAEELKGRANFTITCTKDRS